MGGCSEMTVLGLGSSLLVIIIIKIKWLHYSYFKVYTYMTGICKKGSYTCNHNCIYLKYLMLCILRMHSAMLCISIQFSTNL